MLNGFFMALLSYDCVFLSPLTSVVRWYGMDMDQMEIWVWLSIGLWAHAFGIPLIFIINLQNLTTWEVTSLARSYHYGMGIEKDMG